MSPVVYHGAYGQDATVYRYAKYHPPFTPVQLLETTDYNDIDFASFKHCAPDQTSVLVNGQWWYRNAGSYLPGLIPECVDDAMLAQLLSYDPEAIFNSHWVYMCDGETPQLAPCVEQPAPRRPSPCDTLPCPNPYCDCPSFVEPPIIVEPPDVPPTDVNPPYTPPEPGPGSRVSGLGADWVLPALLIGGALLFFGGSGGRKRSNGLSHGFGAARSRKGSRAVTLDQFQDRTALLPHIVADVVSGGDRAFADSAAERTVALYNRNDMFRREMDGSNSRANLYKWMRHWWASWEYRKSLNEKWGPGTVPLGRARSKTSNAERATKLRAVSKEWRRRSEMPVKELEHPWDWPVPYKTPDKARWEKQQAELTAHAAWLAQVEANKDTEPEPFRGVGRAAGPTSLVDTRGIVLPFREFMRLLASTGGDRNPEYDQAVWVYRISAAIRAGKRVPKATLESNRDIRFDKKGTPYWTEHYRKIMAMDGARRRHG